MNFFKSILSEDSEPQNPDPPNPSSSNRDLAGEPAGEFSGETSGGWSFNGLLKTLATQSESVIEIYTRDLKEFGSGLQKEIKELPNEIDTVLKSTKEIIVKKSSNMENSGKKDEKNEGKYSRFERVLRGLENDENTYVMEVEDKEEYEKWKVGLGLGFKKNGNESVIRFYEKMVPGKVSEEEFWGRYYFRVYKLRQQEELRERIVKRVISGDHDDDEELTWDLDDDDSNGDDDEIKGSKVTESGEMGKKDQVLSDENSAERDIVGKDGVLSDDKSVEKEIEGKIGEADTKGNEKEKMVSEKIEGDRKGKEKDSSEEKNVKVDSKGLGKDVSIVEEDDMGWDEIEDVDSGDEKKVSGISGSKDKVDLRKRLSVTEDDEDLGWDIEDDEEEPVAKPSAK